MQNLVEVTKGEIKAVKVPLALEIAQAQKDLSVVEAALKQIITIHAEYVDKLGNKSSGSKGIAMQINRRIKKAFEHGRDDMSLDEMLLLKSLLAKLSSVIEAGEVSLKSRRAIKSELYATIENYGELVRKLT